MTKKEERLWRELFRCGSELTEPLRVERFAMEKRLLAIKEFLRFFEWMGEAGVDPD